jgi:predicted alpha/beta superfamily hydrolase
VSADLPALARITGFDLTVGDLALRATVVPPAGTHAPGTVPVVVVLDGDLYAGTVAEQAELLHRVGGLRPAVVVGVGYGRGVLANLGLRMGDLVPRPAPVVLERFPGLADPARGADQAFRAALLDDVLPAVCERHPEADPGPGVLLGHSLGAHFVASTLLARPDAFSTYLAVSPSLWWDAFELVRRVRDELPAALAGLPDLPRVALAVGGAEQDPAGAASAGLSIEDLRAARMVDATHDLAEALRAGGLDCPVTTYPGATHGSVFPTACYDLLQHALR